MADVIKRIHSKGPITQEESVAGEAGILPGMILILNSSNQVVKHATAGGDYGDELLVAIEDQLQGKTVSDVYASGDIVTYMIAHIGSELNLLLDDGEAVVIGSKIISTGDGTVKLTTGVPKANIGVATAALDLSASANTANGLVPVRITG